MNKNIISIAERNNKKRIGKKAYFAIMLSMFACVLLMVLQVLISILCVPLVNTVTDKSIGIIVDMIIYVLSFVLSFGFIGILFKLFYKTKSPYASKRYLPQKPILYIMGTIGIGYACSLVTQLLFRNFFEKFSMQQSLPIDTPLSIFLYYIYIALLPAIFEELAFRHVILTNLLPFGKWGAIICSSVLFGIVHIDPPRVIFATVFGVLLAVCREYTGSLVVPMIIHFLNNAISVTLTVAPQDSIVLIAFALSVYVFMIAGIIAMVYYPIKGLNSKKLSLIKSSHFGYKISFPKYLLRFVFNFGIIPLGLMYYFFFYINYLA